MLARFHGSRATRSSLMMRASSAAARPRGRHRPARLRLVHGRFEPAVDADLDEPHQRDEVERTRVENSWSADGGGGEVAVGERRIGDRVDRLVARFRIRSPRGGSRAPPRPRACSRSSGSPARPRPGLRRACRRAARISASVSHSAGSLPAVSGDRIVRALSRSPRRRRSAPGGATSRSTDRPAIAETSSTDRSCRRFERRATAELAERRATSRVAPVRRSGRRTAAAIGRRLSSRSNCSGTSASVACPASRGAATPNSRSAGCRPSPRRAGRRAARVEIFGVERAEPNAHFRGALVIAARLAPARRPGGRTAWRRRACPAWRRVADCSSAYSSSGLELEDLLVERRRLGIEALVGEVVGDAACTARCPSRSGWRGRTDRPARWRCSSRAAGLRRP